MVCKHKCTEDYAELFQSITLKKPNLKHTLRAFAQDGETAIMNAHQQEFQITGSRSRAVTARVVPSLAFVPAAQSFRGYVELLTDETMKLEIDDGTLSAALKARRPF